MSGLDGIAWLHQQHPDVPVVALSSSDDRPTVERALMAGAMGFIPKSANSAVMVNALRLALAGEVYLPPSVFLPSTRRPAPANNHALAEGLLPVPMRTAAVTPVSALPASAHAPVGEAHPRGFTTPEDLGLSRRQAQVLQRLLQGKPTKIICRELVLAEGTVKAHISATLRALNVLNRVQAVIAAARLNLRFNA
jgi:DNA-binding NarL/FixJ family response regulator